MPGSLVGDAGVLAPTSRGRSGGPALAPSATRLFGRGSWPEVRRITDVLRKETVGGTLLVAATVAALGWANSPWSDAYAAVRDFAVGPGAIQLDLTVGQWAADGLLAVFFFVAGLELKREFVAGDLRNPRTALVPVAAAVGGMLVPAGLYALANLPAGGHLVGWAVPTATDIAFALAVLAVVSTHLPSALRTFLLTLAVVDDLLAIVVIAVFYTRELHLLFLALALVPLAAFGSLVQRRIHSWLLLAPVALLTWGLVHASGVHSTVAGVLLAFTVPVIRSEARGGPEAGPGLAEEFEHQLRPVSAGFAVPVFAFFSAGVTVGGLTGLGHALTEPVAVGVVAGLVVGKPVGILGTTWLVGRVAHLPLQEGVSWWDALGVALLGGIGFTVSLLIGELAFGAGSALDADVKVGVLTGSVFSALVAVVVLRVRNRAYRAIAAEEEVDANLDGVPDVFEVEAEGAPPTG